MFTAYRPAGTTNNLFDRHASFAFFIERAARATDFIRRHYTWIMRIGGGMLVLVGLLLVTGLWLDFTIWLRVSIPGFETAL